MAKSFDPSPTKTTATVIDRPTFKLFGEFVEGSDLSVSKSNLKAVGKVKTGHQEQTLRRNNI